jgi:hypothetical protein
MNGILLYVIKRSILNWFYTGHFCLPVADLIKLFWSQQRANTLAYFLVDRYETGNKMHTWHFYVIKWYILNRPLTVCVVRLS